LSSFDHSDPQGGYAKERKKIRVWTNGIRGFGKKEKNMKKEVDEKNRGAYGSQHLIGLRRESGG